LEEKQINPKQGKKKNHILTRTTHQSRRVEGTTSLSAVIFP